MMMFKNQSGVIFIDGDQHIIDRTKNLDLSNVDVSKYRLSADQLAELYLTAKARSSDVNAAKEYVVLKQKFLEKHSK